MSADEHLNQDQFREHVLLHRGISDYGNGGRDWSGKPFSTANEMFEHEGPGGDLHKDIGAWWAPDSEKDLADFYGGGPTKFNEGHDNSGMVVSAYFPKDRVHEPIRSGHEGLVVEPGTVGHVHEVRVRQSGKWKTLPHEPGSQVHVANGADYYF